MVIVNAFSANMLTDFPVNVRFTECSLETARALAVTATSAVGHETAANVFTTVLGTPVAFSRTTITVAPGSESLLLGQYKGPRLPEGATSLPEGATIIWLIVDIG